MIIYPHFHYRLFWTHHDCQISEGADKQLAIADKLDDITDQWDRASFEFTSWKSRGVPVLKVFCNTVYWVNLYNFTTNKTRGGMGGTDDEKVDAVHQASSPCRLGKVT